MERQNEHTAPQQTRADIDIKSQVDQEERFGIEFYTDLIRKFVHAQPRLKPDATGKPPPPCRD